MYSKFLKHLICFLSLVCLLAIVSIALYYAVALNNEYPITGSYQDTLFSGTIGILSASYLQCTYSLIGAGQTSFSLKCANGVVNLVGPVFTN